MDGQAAPDTYQLLRRFSMPNGNGTRDAIAVSHSSGLILVSLYTLMIKAAVTQFWALIVLVGVAQYLKRHTAKKHRPESIIAAEGHTADAVAGLWNARASPEHVALLMTAHVYDTRRTKRGFWYPLLWIVLSALAVAAALGVPIVKTKQVKIGTVAPVAASSIYVPYVPPSNNPNLNTLKDARIYSLGVPAALRAAGAINAVPPDTVFVERVDLPANVNGTNYRMNYRYGVTAAEFGLQHAPGLALNVSGSCVTDYTWFAGLVSQSSGIDTDYYYLWNNPKYEQKTSNLDGGPPFPFLYLNPNQMDLSNASYGVLVSSIDRLSFTDSSDPWYSTIPSQSSNPDNPYPFYVASGRPALSCWETGIWSHKHNHSNVWELQNVPGLKLSDPIIDIFKITLGSPMMFSLGTKLGRAALASSASALGPAFDAKTSSIQNDIERLVNASYIATRNVLAETTRYSTVGRDGIPNQALNANGGQVRAGAGEFVVSNSAEIITLSVRVLIIVPVVLIGVFLLVLILGILPHPWKTTREMNAITLHRNRRPVNQHKHTGASSPEDEVVEDGTVDGIIGEP